VPPANPLSSDLSQVSIPCRVKRATQRNAAHPLATCCGHKTRPRPRSGNWNTAPPFISRSAKHQTRRGENTSRPLDTLFPRETDHLSIVEWARSRGHRLPVPVSIFTCEHEPRMSQLTHPSKSGCAQPSLTNYSSPLSCVKQA
jgi:hypothetical protein